MSDGDILWWFDLSSEGCSLLGQSQVCVAKQTVDVLFKHVPQHFGEKWISEFLRNLHNKKTLEFSKAISVECKHLGGVLEFGYSELLLNSVRVEEVASEHQ